jgi:hypothetical protein
MTVVCVLLIRVLLLDFVITGLEESVFCESYMQLAQFSLKIIGAGDTARKK